MALAAVSSLSTAVSAVEAHVLDGSGAASLRESLRVIASHAARSDGTAGETSEEKAYAVQTMLSLLRRSDTEYSTCFKTLGTLGVSLDELHGHAASAQQLDALTYAFLSSQQEEALKSVSSRSCLLRMHVKSCSSWPRVCQLILCLGKFNPFFKANIVLQPLLVDASDCFLEFVSAPSSSSSSSSSQHHMLLSVNLNVGRSQLENPAFLASLWTTARHYASPSGSSSAIESLANLFFHTGILRRAFSEVPGARTEGGQLPSSLLHANLSSPENLSLFCTSAAQLIRATVARAEADLDLLRKGSDCPATLLSLENDGASTATPKVACIETIHRDLNSRAMLDLHLHLCTCGWQVQTLGARLVSRIGIAQVSSSSPNSQNSQSKTTSSGKKRKKQDDAEPSLSPSNHHPQMTDDDVLVLFFCWTGQIPDESQLAALRTVVSTLVSAAQNDLSTKSATFQSSLAQFWAQQAADQSAAPEDILRALLVVVNVALSIILAAESENQAEGNVGSLVDAFVEQCRLGLATASGDRARWSHPESAAGYIGMVMLLDAAESEYPIAGGSSKAVLHMLAARRSEEGAPICDLARTLPRFEALALSQRMENKS